MFCADLVLDSDVIHANVLGTDVIIVNSSAAAVDLFKKRSAFYSSRLVSVILEPL